MVVIYDQVRREIELLGGPPAVDLRCRQIRRSAIVDSFETCTLWNQHCGTELSEIYSEETLVVCIVMRKTILFLHLTTVKESLLKL